ncbi:MAG: rod shape-determining protein MreC [Patescibacteria group bacterium]|nr:rod shape-determining protein MreC [Patescibacteria group bacterium]
MSHRRTFYIILAIVIILGGHYLGLWRPIERLATRALSYPLTAGYSWGRDFFSFFGRFQNNADLKKENQDLKERTAVLDGEIISLKEALRQKGITDEQLEFLKQEKLKAVLARVITRGVENNPNQLIIDKGARDGIKNGLVILGRGGVVVGRVTRVEDTSAQILLLTDTSVEMGAADVDGGLLGVVKGNKDLSLRLNYVLKEKKITKGDIIITSGEKDLIPAGLLIGEIDQVFEDEREIFKSARLTQPVDVANTDIVSVILF